MSDRDKALESLESRKKDSPLITKAFELSELELTERKTKLEDGRKGQDSVAAAVGLAQVARRFVNGREELVRLEDTISKIRDTQKNLAERQQARNEHIAPDDKTLKAIRKAISNRDAAQVRLDAALTTLEIVPVSDSTAEVLSGENIGPVNLKAGAVSRIQGSPEIVADLPGIARIRAFGPTGTVEDFRKERALAEESLSQLSMSFGTDNIEALESLNETSTELDGELQTTKATLETLLSDRELDDLIQQHTELKATLDEAIKEHLDWDTTPPDAHALETQAAKVRTVYEDEIARCEEYRDKAQEAWSIAKDAMTRTEVEVTSANQQLENLEGQLSKLTQENKPVAELEAEAKVVLMEWEAAKTFLKGAEEGLKKYPGDPRTTVEQLDAQVKDASKDAESARETEIRAEGDLQRISAEGPYSSLSRAEEKVVQLKSDVAREQLRVDAIKLLHETVTACRTEAIAAVARPVENSATQTLQRIAGLKLGRVQIDESFTPSGVVPDGHDATVELDSLSGGEREQLYLATRLALADAIGEKERQLVVIDDVLTATDSGRLARIRTILEESAERFQILILTCHRERYLGLKHTKFIDLEQVLQ